MSAPGAGPRHQTTLTVLMTPDMANFSGNVHGGAILKLLDQVAFTCASRYAQTYVVTLPVDRVAFREPISTASVRGAAVRALPHRVASPGPSRSPHPLGQTLSVDRVVFREPIYIGELV